MRVLWFGETIKQAIDAARLHHQLLPPYVYAETEFPKVILLVSFLVSFYVRLTHLGRQHVYNLLYSL